MRGLAISRANGACGTSRPSMSRRFNLGLSAKVKVSRVEMFMSNNASFAKPYARTLLTTGTRFFLGVTTARNGRSVELFVLSETTQVYGSFGSRGAK